MSAGTRGLTEQGHRKRRLAMAFVVLLGVVSLLSEVSNGGAKSVTGPYLALLGVGAASVTFVSGLSELLGYSLRALFGWVTDHSGRYWLLVFLGYGINLVAVPALALAGDWGMAVALMMFERVGRAMRGPARDAMLSHASVNVGRGWAYGVQGALCSVGGMLGPIVMVAVLLLDGGYQLGLELLALPMLAAMAVLAFAWRINPSPREMEGRCPSPDVSSKMPKTYWLLVLAGALIAAGYSDFPLVALHMNQYDQTSTSWTPILYAVAMAAGALSALVLGKVYDRKGMYPLVLVSASVPVFVPMVFSPDIVLVFAGMVLYGIGLGAQESIMRAMVADMASHCRRGSAFGYYNSAFGVSWFSGSVIIGLLYSTSVFFMVVFSMALQLAAVPILLVIMKGFKFKRRDQGL